MRRSMTAYGRAHLITSSGRWALEISSVNRKGLDIHLSLPATLLFLDPDLRKWLGEHAQRGQISVRVSFEAEESKRSLEALKEHKKKWEKVAKALGFPTSAVDFQFLVDRYDPQQASVDEKTLRVNASKVFKAACTPWIAMREKEGAALVQDIEKRLQKIRKEVQKIAKRQPELLEKYRARLKDRMKEINITLDEEKIVREAALVAEKADITEEITRLYSHADQMEEYLCSPEISVGRTLDFLAQEMGREIGTLMAKAGEVAIANMAITIKSEIEKIREQVQNIE